MYMQCPTFGADPLILLLFTFYPTIAALFASNRPAVYTIAIYGRVTSEVNIAKMHVAAIFSLDSSLANE